MKSELKWLHNKKKPSLDLHFSYRAPANHRMQICLLLPHATHNARLRRSPCGPTSYHKAKSQRETIAGLLTQKQRPDASNVLPLCIPTATAETFCPPEA